MLTLIKLTRTRVSVCLQAIVDSQPDNGGTPEAGLEDGGAGDMGDGDGGALDHSEYQQDFQQDADAAAAAAADGSSVDGLAAMAALQQHAAAAGVGGHAGLLDPQALAASMAATAQLQSFQQGLQGLGAEGQDVGQGMGAAEQAALQAALQAGIKAE